MINLLMYLDVVLSSYDNCYDWVISSIIPSTLTDIIELITKAKTNTPQDTMIFNKASYKLPLE